MANFQLPISQYWRSMPMRSAAARLVCASSASAARGWHCACKWFHRLDRVLRSISASLREQESFGNCDLGWKATGGAGARHGECLKRAACRQAHPARCRAPAGKTAFPSGRPGDGRLADAVHAAFCTNRVAGGNARSRACACTAEGIFRIPRKRMMFDAERCAPVLHLRRFLRRIPGASRDRRSAQ